MDIDINWKYYCVICLVFSSFQSWNPKEKKSLTKNIPNRKATCTRTSPHHHLSHSIPNIITSNNPTLRPLPLYHTQYYKPHPSNPLPSFPIKSFVSLTPPPLPLPPLPKPLITRSSLRTSNPRLAGRTARPRLWTCSHFAKHRTETDKPGHARLHACQERSRCSVAARCNYFIVTFLVLRILIHRSVHEHLGVEGEGIGFYFDSESNSQASIRS